MGLAMGQSKKSVTIVCPAGTTGVVKSLINVYAVVETVCVSLPVCMSSCKEGE